MTLTPTATTTEIHHCRNRSESSCPVLRSDTPALSTRDVLSYLVPSTSPGTLVGTFRQGTFRWSWGVNLKVEIPYGPTGPTPSSPDTSDTPTSELGLVFRRIPVSSLSLGTENR